jgi:hypothetical protein
MADSPQKYTLDADVLGMVWSALYESGHDELARVVSDMFWKNYMEERNILHVVPTDKKELN